MEKLKWRRASWLVGMRSVKLDDEVYARLLKLRAELTIMEMRPLTFSDVVKLLLDAWEAGRRPTGRT